MRDAIEATTEHARQTGYTDDQIAAVTRVLADADHGEALAADASMHAARHSARATLDLDRACTNMLVLLAAAERGVAPTPGDVRLALRPAAAALTHLVCGRGHHKTVAAEMGWTNR